MRFPTLTLQENRSMSQKVSECLDAFKKGNKEDAVRLLPQIQQPAEVTGDIIDLKTSLLHHAAWHGWLDVVIELATKYKCDINCKNRFGVTPIHYAAWNDQLEVMKYFINEQHFDPMTRNDIHYTLLHNACQCGRLDITHFLISEAHCDPSCKDKDGDTPLHYACRYGHTNMHCAILAIHW